MMGSEMDTRDGCDGPPIIHTVGSIDDHGGAKVTEIKLGSIPSQRFELRHKNWAGCGSVSICLSGRLR